MKRVLAIKSRKNLDITLMKNGAHNSNMFNSNLKMKKSKSSENLYIPQVPFFCPLTKQLRDNEYVREVLIYDENKKVKPRLTWYEPNDKMIPTDWFVDGIYSDLDYYFNDYTTN